MFKTKLEVDKHVDNCLKKINNETERNLKSFSFAKLYYSVGDYEQARRYILSYLNVKPKSAEGYQLLGKCLEKMNKKDAALEAYKNSLQIDSNQNNLVIKVCELLSSDDIDMDHSGARYFCELAQSFDPNNTAVYRLKEKLISKQASNPKEISTFLLKELENRPTDINLRVRLLKHFLQHNMVLEAYQHASSIEEKDFSLFHENLSWYETFTEILLRIQRDVSFKEHITWEFWMLSVTVLDRLVTLSLNEQIGSVKTSAEYTTTVFNFDQILTKASRNVNSCPDRQLISIFLCHYYGQLNFHLTTLAYKQAKHDLLSFKEVSNSTIPLLLSAYHSYPPDIQSLWYTHTTEKNKRLVQQWHKEASYRCSQSGHILFASTKNRKSLFMEKATQYSTGMWREQFFKKVFVKRDHHLNITTSFFVSNPQSNEPVFKLPELEEIRKHDEVAQLMYPDSLHHYIWIALNYKNLSNVEVKTFEGLPYSVKNFHNCAAESLSLLDIQAFIYCATLCAKSKLADKKSLMYYNKDKPKVLPASITDSMGTLDQSKFLKFAYKIYKNERDSNMSEVRLLLIKGIEVVRCVGNHGLDVELLVKLAEIFEERIKNLTKQSEIEFATSRAELYWKAALPLLEKIKNNQHINYPNSRIFEFKSNMSLSEALSYIEKGTIFTAVQMMKKKEYEKALRIFEQLKDPYASFYQSQIYKHMADQKTNDSKENVTSEMRSQHIILLSKARDCLYLTLDRLREPSMDRSHPLNAQLGTEIEKMERLLSRIDPDCTNRNECDGMSDENASSENSVGEQYLSTYTHTSLHNGHPITPKHESHIHSTPLRFNITRQEAKPSPERLDAQIRQMAASRDAAFSNIAEQNKVIIDSHHSLLEELRTFKDVVNTLVITVNELKCIKMNNEQIRNIEKSLQDFRNSFDLSNIQDSIQEIKKEIHELKKDQNKNNQLSDEDLHFLDPEYAVDYNINANLGYPTNIPNIYSSYQSGRLQNPNPLSAYSGLYPGLYPGFYGPLALPQTGAIPFAPEQNLAAAATPGYAQHPLSQTSLPPVLPTSSTGLNVNMIQGQTLSQTMNHSPRLLPANTSGPAPTANLLPTSKAPPVNVVITSSDPLPTNVVPVSQPILSVTIPPHHIKGNKDIPKSQPHNYQIPLPNASLSQMVTPPSILNKQPPVVTTQSILSDVAPPAFSAIPKNKDNFKTTSCDGKLLETTPNNENNTTLNVSNISATSVDEHDPCPDFKPIIPLPDEVPIHTGEEGETELFCEHAKLFRHVNTNGTKEWKERGSGKLKILLNSESGKIRILMRRDQVHKICANHFINNEMTLTPMVNNDKAFIWVAHDFADEVVVVETFCVRFKTIEQAKSFNEAFTKAKQNIGNVAGISSKNKNSKKCESLINKDNTTRNVTNPSIGTKLPEGFSFVCGTKNEVKKAETSLTLEKPSSVESSTKASTLGGFVFTSTPTFKPKESITIEKTPELQSTPKSSSPFSNFTFGKTISYAENQISTSEAPKFTPLVIQKDTSSNTNEDDTSHAEEFVPTAEFKPVVTLPELIEVKTGEEDLEVLFENRCKLYRYDGEAKEWKERGVGNIKVLKGEDIRLIMRREQVHKVCCNHTVTKNMNFALKDTVGKAIVWTAQDFSEGVLRTETFTARFKTTEQAEQFLHVLQSAQTSMDDNNKIVNSKHHKPDSRPRTTSFGDKFKQAKGSWECKNCYVINEGKTNFCVACETGKTGTTPKKTEESGPVFSFGNFSNKNDNSFSVKSNFTPKPASSWGDSFKAPEGSWECSTCCVRNNSENKSCIACMSLKKSDAATKDNDSKLKDEKCKTGFGDAFKPPTGSWECKMCYVRNKQESDYCLSCDSPKDNTIPKKDSAPKGINLETPGLSFNFGMPAIATTTPTTVCISNSSPMPTKTGQENLIFGSPHKGEFEFKPKSPRRISSGQADEESDSNYTEEEEDNIYFKPVIPLPDKVDVKTGEEEEEVLYCHRAKLFRFVDSEWKERGVGDIKILKRKDNGKLRIVMRRDQVLKICLNHILTNEIEYIKKDDKSWLFSAPDYSENIIVHEKFCLRFKTPDVAQEFKQAVSDALMDLNENGATKSQNKISENDVELISESKVTPEEEKEALALGLPPKFFAYRQLPDCSCDQCKKDDEYLKELFDKDSSSKTTGILKGPKFMFGGTKSATFSFQPQEPIKPALSSTPPTPPKNETLKDILLRPSKLEAISSDKQETIAENNQKENNSNQVTSKPFPFSNPFTPSTTSIFSSQNTTSIFGGGNTSNLFGSNSSTSGIFKSAFSTNENSNTKAAEGFFGSKSNSGISSNTSIFNINPSSTGTYIFGGNTNNSMDTNNSTTAPVFATNTFTFGVNTKTEPQSSPSFPIFETKALTTPATNLSPGKISENIKEPEATTINLKEDDEVVLKCKTDVSFASLAANTTEAFSTKGDGSFAFSGARAPVFGSSSKSSKKKPDKKDISKADSDNEEAHDEEEYDPHFEPIVPLPEAIVVSTGEEDETVLFNERSKLFRFNGDTKEWKERGVGQLKILHHPTNHTYRLLLRREQVHKVVLNQLIIPTLQLQPMMSSDKAWMWAGYNYTDDGSELEKLAARFKNSETAQKFKSVFQDCVEKVIEIQNNKSVPSTVQNYGLEDLSGDEQNQQEGNSNEEYEDEEDEDERYIKF